MGANYSFSGLQRHFGVDFNLERDVEAIAASARSNSKRKSAIENQSTEGIVQLLLANRDKETLSVTGEAFEMKPQSIQEESKASPTPREGELTLAERISTESGKLNEKTDNSIPSVSESESPNQLSQLSDAQLLNLVRTVEQWKKTRPKEPSLDRGESVKKRIDDLNQQRAFLEKKLPQLELQLKLQLKPRSLLNPFGVKAELIEEKQDSLLETKMALSDIKLQLDRVQADFKQWQKGARAYLAWQEDPQTKQMNELAELLNSPPIQERLQRIEQGYAIYALACYILDEQGTKSKEGRYVRGNVYRIEQRGETLTIFPKERSEPIYEATDRRSAGGIIEISQFNLTEQDRKIIQGYVRDLEEQNRKKSHQVERGGFDIGG